MRRVKHSPTCNKFNVHIKSIAHHPRGASWLTSHSSSSFVPTFTLAVLPPNVCSCKRTLSYKYLSLEIFIFTNIIHHPYHCHLHQDHVDSFYVHMTNYFYNTKSNVYTFIHAILFIWTEGFFLIKRKYVVCLFVFSKFSWKNLRLNILQWPQGWGCNIWPLQKKQLWLMALCYKCCTDIKCILFAKYFSIPLTTTQNKVH